MTSHQHRRSIDLVNGKIQHPPNLSPSLLSLEYISRIYFLKCFFLLFLFHTINTMLTVIATKQPMHQILTENNLVISNQTIRKIYENSTIRKIYGEEKKKVKCFFHERKYRLYIMKWTMYENNAQLPTPCNSKNPSSREQKYFIKGGQTTPKAIWKLSQLFCKFSL